MGRIYDIANGWAKYLYSNNPAYVVERAMKCKQCPHAVKGSYEKLMPDFSLKKIQGLKCNLCNCPLSTAIRSKNKKCPIGKW